MGQIYLLTLVINLWVGLLPHFFVVKIKDEDETLEAWNFILKLFKPSFADLVKNYLARAQRGPYILAICTTVNPKSAKMTCF